MKCCDNFKKEMSEGVGGYYRIYFCENCGKIYRIYEEEKKGLFKIVPKNRWHEFIEID